MGRFSLKMVKLVLLFGVFILLSSMVSALNFTAEFDRNVVVKEYSSTLEFTAKITDATPGTYNLYTLADMSLFPRDSFEINKSSFEKKFTIKPTESLDVLGLYVFTVTLNHRNFEKVDKKIAVKIVELEDILEIGADPLSLDSDVLNFYVENKEDVLIENVSAEFSSILFKVDSNFNLQPFEKRYFEVVVDEEILKKTKAGVYVIEAKFDTPQGSREISGNIFLGEKKGVSTIPDSSGFFIKTNSITKVNTGNVNEKVEVIMDKNIISRLFTTFNVKPETIEREGFTVRYSWSEELEPTAIFKVSARTNYLFPFLILVFGFAVVIAWRRYSITTLEMKKSVSHVKTKGGEFALKVKISVKARKKVKNVSVVDRVPSIVKIYKKFGTLRPDKIDPEARKLHWNLGDLNAGEERIFNYIIYSRVGFVGKFSLPETVALYEKEGKIHEVSSNQVFFLSDQIKGEE